MSEHACATPLDYERFLTYWFGELDAAEEERIELQLLTCAECGERAEAWSFEVQGVKEAMGQLSKGLLEPAEVEALGSRATIVDVAGSGRVELPLERDNIHVFRVTLDHELVAGCDRIDVVYTKQGLTEPHFHVSDLPRSQPGPYYLACSGHVLACHGNDLMMRVVGTRGGEAVTLLESSVHFV